MTALLGTLTLLGVAALAMRAQEQAERQRRRPADPAWVAQFIASRGTAQ
jgi:hypothetical protein